MSPHTRPEASNKIVVTARLNSKHPTCPAATTPRIGPEMMHNQLGQTMTAAMNAQFAWTIGSMPSFIVAGICACGFCYKMKIILEEIFRCFPCAKETHRRSGDCPICRTPISWFFSILSFFQNLFFSWCNPLLSSLAVCFWMSGNGPFAPGNFQKPSTLP